MGNKEVKVKVRMRTRWGEVIRKGVTTSASVSYRFSNDRECPIRQLNHH
jgi:hypothetical protein